jgi:preprotein translocase subunit SecG
MNWTLVVTILQVLSGLAVSVIILMQSGKSAGLSGAIAGGAETFLSKGKAKTLDQKLAKLTKWICAGLRPADPGSAFHLILK